MHVNVIEAGVDSYDYLIYPEQNPINQTYIQNQLNNFSSTLTDVGMKFVEASRAIYEKINDSTAIRTARAAVRMAKGMFHPNMIVPLESIDDIRAAQPMMQRYIMADPTIRALYHNQQCDGYSDTYVDLEPGRIADNHYDYRRVMDAMVFDAEDADGDYEWRSKNYYEELAPGDRELTFQEKNDILTTWSVMDMFIEAGKDPSNIFESDVDI